MECRNCGNKAAVRWRMAQGKESCDRCGGLGAMSVPDVYFREPYLDPNLPHPKRPEERNGVWVRSKEHKKALMREQNLVEVGDVQHGGRDFDRKSAEQMTNAGYNNKF